MRTRLLTLLAFMVLFITAGANAALQFAKTEIDVKASTQDKELQARYAFTNTGSAPIWIVQLTTSCGCTKAIADKTELQPGESGTVTATYTIGLNQGRHTHTINVQTSEPNAQPYVLKITADLPTGTTPLVNTGPTIAVSPRDLTWTRPPYATKTILVDLQQVPTAKIAATCDSDQFELKLDDTSRPATIQVTPRASAGALRAEITLVVTPPDASPITQKVQLTVLSLKSR